MPGNSQVAAEEGRKEAEGTDSGPTAIGWAHRSEPGVFGCRGIFSDASPMFVCWAFQAKQDTNNRHKCTLELAVKTRKRKK